MWWFVRVFLRRQFGLFWALLDSAGVNGDCVLALLAAD